MRRKAAEAAEQAGAASSGDTPEVAAPGRASQTWAMLIKRVYEIDPLCCPKCQGQMKVIAFICSDSSVHGDGAPMWQDLRDIRPSQPRQHAPLHGKSHPENPMRRGSSISQGKPFSTRASLVRG